MNFRNKSNKSVERQQCSTEKNIKGCKSQRKKSRVKKCFHTDKLEATPDTSSTRRLDSSNDQQKMNNKPVTPTKVKSASWKRSEKSTTPFNALTNKKHKKTSNWLKFSNTKLKNFDPEQDYKRNDSLSVCRPGTSYSDVLFGAGCSNLVKIKNCITPRFYSSQTTNTAPKKLNKSLFKYSGKPENRSSQQSEAEERKFLFPALQTIKNKLFSATLKINSSNSNNNAEETSLDTFLSSSPNKTAEAEVLTFPEMEKLISNEQKVSYYNFLEHDSKSADLDLDSNAANIVDGNKYLYNSINKIPKWNFMSVETGTSDGFPKFLCQFEDENYLKAEKMALLGLKLALGNCTPNNK